MNEIRRITDRGNRRCPDADEQRVLDAGFETTNHGDYEPERRFYFEDHDGLEFEIVSYR